MCIHREPLILRLWSQSCGGKGVINMKTSSKIGKVTSINLVDGHHRDDGHQPIRQDHPHPTPRASAAPAAAPPASASSTSTPTIIWVFKVGDGVHAQLDWRLQHACYYLILSLLTDLAQYVVSSVLWIIYFGWGGRHRKKLDDNVSPPVWLNWPELFALFQQISFSSNRILALHPAVS